MPQQIVWRTEKRKVDDLLPNAQNPRQMNEMQTESLKLSLKRFNLVEIPAINTDNKIIAGHQRVKILQLLDRGQEMIDVRVPDRKLTQKEYDEYLLRSNANTGSWDYELLKNFDIDLLLDIGLDNSDLSLIWDQQLEVEDDDFQVEKEIQKIKETDIKLGDIFALGPHRLLCADSTKPETVKKLLAGKQVNMVYCDPIYNINLSYDKGIGGKANYGGKTDDKKSDVDYREFLKQTMTNALSVCQKDAHVFYYCDQNYIGLVQSLYQELGIKHKRVCLWVKNGFNATPQVAFNKSFEPCVYGTIGRPYLSETKNLNEIMNKEIGTGNRTFDDILDIIDIWLAKRLPGQEYIHSTQKPLTLHEKPLRRCTKVGDIVLDLFGGSGSTLLSCEQLKRICYTAEIDPIFCQLIINRYEHATGQKARKLN